MEGKLKAGVFWPQAVWEEHFNKKLNQSALQTYTHGSTEYKGPQASIEFLWLGSPWDLFITILGRVREPRRRPDCG